MRVSNRLTELRDGGDDKDDDIRAVLKQCPGASVSTSDLYDRFKLNATPSALSEVKSKRSFGMYLSRLGYKSKRVGDYHMRVGIWLRDGGELDEDVDEDPSKVRRPVDYCQGFR